MDHSPRHVLPSSDAFPWPARLALYVLAILAPFVGLMLGRLDGDETLGAIVTLLGVIGPAVAVAYDRKAQDEQAAHYRAGYVEAVSRHVLPYEPAPDEHPDPDELHDDPDRRN